MSNLHDEEIEEIKIIKLFEDIETDFGENNHNNGLKRK
jgi:hypothetical protein